MHRFISFIFLFFLLICSHGQNLGNFPPNTLVEGHALISGNISLLSKSEKDSITLEVLTTDFLTGTGQKHFYTVVAGKDFIIKIPVDTEYAIASLTLFNKEETIGRTFLGLSQKSPTKVYIPQGQAAELLIEHGIGLDTKSIEAALQVFFYALEMGEELSASASTNTGIQSASPQASILQQMDFIRKKIQESNISPDIVEWAMNYATFVRLESLLYTQQSDSLTADGYDILAKMNIKGEFLPYYTLGGFRFLQTLLKTPLFGLTPIDGQEINNWKTTAKRQLYPSIDSSQTQLFDLLAFTSFLSQIQEERHPFTSQQIINIETYSSESYYLQGLKQLLLLQNQYLVESLQSKRKSRFYDYSEDELVTIEKVLSLYRNKAVLIDFWYTGCRPCLIVKGKIEALMGKKDFEKIAYLSITDIGLSPKANWNAFTRKQKGDHFILPQHNCLKILNSYQRTTFPTFLLLDKQHRIVYCGDGVDFYKLTEAIEALEK